MRNTLLIIAFYLMIPLHGLLKNAANTIQGQVSDVVYWGGLLKGRFGLNPRYDTGVYNPHVLLREIFLILRPIPPELIKCCGIYTVLLRSDMGPNRPYYPNHGYFTDHMVAINADVFWHPDQPDEFMDHRGYFLTRGQQTVLHEFGHGFDAHHEDLSLKPAWLGLSGWSETEKPGLKRLVIKEPGTPEVKGEWWHASDARFTRFYARRNPWDDWADCFSFYVAGLRHNIPAEKNGYFDEILGHFYV